MKNKHHLFLLTCVLAFITVIILSFRSDPDPEKWQYCTVTVSGSPFSAKVSVFVDYGQHNGARPKKENFMKDSTGEIMGFNSPIDALNYLGKDGWKCITGYEPASVGYIQYLMCRRVE